MRGLTTAWMSRTPGLRRAGSAIRESEAAQTLVEFSLVLPLFLVLIFALVDFGRAFFSWQIVTNAAREGARTGAVQGDAAAVDNQVFSTFCSGWPDSSTCSIDSSKITINKVNVNGPRGELVSVTVSFDYDYATPIGPMLSLIGGDTLAEPTISSTTSMRLE